MRLRHLYLALCVLGALFPLRHIALFFMEHGFDTAEFFRQIYATRIGAFFTADVVASAVVLITFVETEGRRVGIPRYWLSYFGLVIGVSLAFPWFLYMRQKRMDSSPIA